MNKIAWVVCLLLFIRGFAFAADAPATQPVTVTGTLEKPHTNIRPDKDIAALGRNGVLFIRSQERWDKINTFLPDLTPDKPLPKLDFTKQSVVLIYAADPMPCMVGFTLAKCDLAASPPQLDFSWGWLVGAINGYVDPATKFILAVIPVAPVVKVTLESHCINDDKPSSWPEFSATLGGKDGGDIVDGLQASITPKAAIIKPGDDILIDFALHLADLGDAKPQQFGTIPKSIYVWDNRISLGYRNHTFFVTTPDGKITLLRPRERLSWRWNPSILVEITAKQSYHLSSGNQDGGNLKSLKELGVDTSTPGTYTITGVYEETGGAKDLTAAGDKKRPFWGGSIASNTVAVEVKP